jgi:DNA-directed RNA polymerase subunit M/transcription elongation factor TFIIS
MGIQFCQNADDMLIDASSQGGGCGECIQVRYDQTVRTRRQTREEDVAGVYRYTMIKQSGRRVRPGRRMRRVCTGTL